MKQKKIGIITIPDYNNYGNRLQNYAVKHVLEGLGCQVDTLEMNDTAFPQYKARSLKLSLKKYGLGGVATLFEYLHGGALKAKRYARFARFTKRRLNVRYFPHYDQKTLDRIRATYDYVVLGSDQIWHPTVNTTPNLFFATFMPRERVLFFSPSFGIHTLPDPYRQTVREGLAGCDRLTVREEAGAALLRDLTGMSATVLPDPTMCLTAEEWKAVAVKPKNAPATPYVLKCFLGGVTEEYRAVTERLSADKTVWEVARKDNPDGYVTGPEEFLGSILGAETVLTDSFHAVVFCILFQKPFVVFPRLDAEGNHQGLDSRLDTLLARMGLTHRKYTGATADLGECSFERTHAPLEEGRALARRFFTEIL